jgi:hypothetical protein
MDSGGARSWLNLTLMDEVGKANSAIFMTVYLTSGFWQQLLQEKSRQYMAFSVPGKGAKYQ